MKVCIGTPAELSALQYIEGTLPESEMEQFEEHYFDCPVCLAHLRAIQALGQELARKPVAPLRKPEAKVPLGWPARFWTAGAVAALLLLSVFTYMNLESRRAQPAVFQNQPKSIPQTELTAQPPRSFAAPVPLSQLADLALPAFIAPNLRGESRDAHFDAGMKEYVTGNCHGAVAVLSQVPSESAEMRAAEFYSGACQMHLGDFSAATGLLRKVADAGDSPQQEAALYSLAQIALAGNDPAAAHAYLQRTISLRGDLEAHAREQDRRIAEWTGQGKTTKGKNPATK